MHISKFSIEQPILVNLSMILIIVAGLMAFRNIPKEEFPEISLNGLSIVTAYPGVSPEEIEELITKPIEEEISDIDDIDNISSFSSEGRSLVTIEFTLDADDIYRKLQEVQSEIEKIKDLPKDAEDPEITETKHMFQLITVGLTAGGTEHQMKEVLDDMVYAFKKIYGVSEVEVLGDREREIWVEVNPLRLEGYGLALADVVRSIKGKNINLPGGTMKLKHDEIIVRTVGKIGTVKEIENIVIRKSTAGGHVYLRDLARVSDTFEEPTLISHLNGKRSFNITVRKAKVGNIIDIVEDVKKVAKGFEPRLPPGAEIVFANDNSVYLQKRLNLLYSNGIFGLILVLCSLFIFIGARAAVITALGIPVAFFASVLLMNFFDITVNSLSLFGIIIVLGMIVDDAIIVAENVYRYIEQGLPVKEAALIGSREVLWPVTASVLTTIAAFMPMLLMAGPLGVFMGIIPKVVTFALAASLWEAFFLLPSHLAEFSRPVRQKNMRGAGSTWFIALQSLYTSLLTKILHRRYRSIFSIAGFGILVLIIAIVTLDVVLFPNQEFETFLVKAELDPSTKIEQTEAVCFIPEKLLLDLPSEENLSVEANIGMKTANLGLKEGGYEYASSFAQIKSRLSDHQTRNRSAEEILNSIREKIASMKNGHLFRVDKEMAGPPVGKAVAVRILGDDFRILEMLSNKIMEELGKIKGVVDIEDNFRPGKDELQVIVDEDKAALYNLDVESIANTIRYAYKGNVATKFRSPNDEADILVKFDAQTRNNFRRILDIKIPNADGAMIPLKNVAKTELISGYGKIRRYDEKRVITVTANIETGVNTSRTVNLEIKKIMEPYIQKYPDYIMKLGGEYEDTEKSMASLLQSFGLAMFLIYIIITCTFKSFIQPFMLMFTIPLAVMGVFVGLIIMRTPIGMMSFMGIIALSGIVVNDSIVLIDFINKRIAEGGDRIAAIIDASKTRLRPILLTSITTILGLMPLALGIFGKEQMLTPMAISIVWGLFFSSILTLLLIPCLYAIVDDLKNGRRKKN